METEEENEEFADAFGGIGQQEQRFYSHLNDSLRDNESRDSRMCCLHRFVQIDVNTHHQGLPICTKSCRDRVPKRWLEIGVTLHPC